MVTAKAFDIVHNRIWINNNPKLTSIQKVELLKRLMELSEKRKVIFQSTVFMLNNPSLFPELDHVLEALSRVNNSDSLGLVEVYLQKQIDMVSHMEVVEETSKKVDKQKDFTLENKSLCLYGLQSMIDALSTYKLKTGVSDYMPKYWQEKAQAMLLANSNGLNLDVFEKSMYSDEYKVANNPKWKFFNREKMQENLVNLAHARTTGKAMIRANKIIGMEEELYKNFDKLKGTANICDAEVTKTPDEKISRIVVNAMIKFSAMNNYRDNIQKVYNFTRGEFNKQDEDVTDKILHDTFFTVLRGLIEKGNVLMQTASAKSVVQNEKGRE